MKDSTASARSVGRIRPAWLLVTAVVASIVVSGVPWLLVALDVANGAKAYLCVWWALPFFVALVPRTWELGGIAAYTLVVLSTLFADVGAFYGAGRLPPRRWAIPVGVVSVMALHVLNFYVNRLTLPPVI